MVRKYLVTVLLYGKDPFHMLDLIVQLNEMVKARIKEDRSKVTKEAVDTFCAANNILGAKELKSVRGDYVHNFHDVRMLLNDLDTVCPEHIVSHLKVFGVGVEVEFVMSELEDLKSNLIWMCDVFRDGSINA